MSGPGKLIQEIHRRSLWQILGIYLAASWIVLQVIDVIGNRSRPRRMTYGRSSLGGWTG